MRSEQVNYFKNLPFYVCVLSSCTRISNFLNKRLSFCRTLRNSQDFFQDTFNILFILTEKTKTIEKFSIITEILYCLALVQPYNLQTSPNPHSYQHPIISSSSPARLFDRPPNNLPFAPPRRARHSHTRLIRTRSPAIKREKTNSPVARHRFTHLPTRRPEQKKKKPTAAPLFIPRIERRFVASNLFDLCVYVYTRRRARGTELSRGYRQLAREHKFSAAPRRVYIYITSLFCAVGGARMVDGPRGVTREFSGSRWMMGGDKFKSVIAGVYVMYTVFSALRVRMFN